MNQLIGNYIIRDWRMEDAPSIAQYANNRRIWMNLRDAFPHPYTLSDAETFILHAIESGSPLFAIATDSEAIGSIGLTLGKDVHRYTAEVGYWLAEPFWRRGIMTQALKFITTDAIDNLKLHRVYAEPYATNPASARVLEKAGYGYEGTLRSNVFKDGQILNQFLYSYLARMAD